MSMPKTPEGAILDKIAIQKNGAYFLYRVPKVARGMHGKTKGHVDELLIVGVPAKHFRNFCEKEGIKIEEGTVFPWEEEKWQLHIITN